MSTVCGCAPPSMALSENDLAASALETAEKLREQFDAEAAMRREAEAANKEAREKTHQRDRSEARISGPADVSAGAAARSLPRCGDAGSDDARLESNAGAADAWRPTAPRTRRYDRPEERADGRRLGG